MCLPKETFIGPRRPPHRDRYFRYAARAAGQYLAFIIFYAVDIVAASMFLKRERRVVRSLQTRSENKHHAQSIRCQRSENKNMHRAYDDNDRF